MNNIIKSNRFYPHEIIDNNGQVYLYNIITSGLFLLDNVSGKILDGNELEEVDKEEYEVTIEFMKQNFIIKNEENDRKLDEIYSKSLINKNKMNPSSLVLMVSQECNLRCIYCYGVNGEYNHKGFMDEKTAKTAIDYFVKYTSRDKLNICFFGGEPLLKFELIKNLVGYAKSLEKEKSKSFSFSMTTNATLINAEIEAFIIKNNIYTTISIDGDSKVQNSNRFYSNKKGCYDDVIKNTSKLRKTDLLTARATISPQNVDVEHCVDHLIDIGFERIAWAPALNLLSDNEIDKMLESEKKIVSKIGKYIEEGDFTRAKKYLTIVDILKKLNTDGLRTKGCGAGNNIMTVNIDGNIYPCHRFVGNDSMKLGNINSDIQCKNDSFYLNVGLKEFKKCETCFSRNICAGGCVNENFENNQDIRLSPEKRCRFYRELTKEILKLYIMLDDEKRRKLFMK